MSRSGKGEDREVWERLAETIRPLKGRPAPPKAPKKPVPKARLEPALSQHSAIPRLERRPPHLDRRMVDKIVRGEVPLDARLDLHGMSEAAAHAALNRFVANALVLGHRRALVITGKGQGILRSAVPRWLAEPPLNTQVTATGRAAIRHGGEGAFYLLIRRRDRDGNRERGGP